MRNNTEHLDPNWLPCEVVKKIPCPNWQKTWKTLVFSWFQGMIEFGVCFLWMKIGDAALTFDFITYTYLHLHMCIYIGCDPLPVTGANTGL